MNIFITGVTGYIGSAVAVRMIKAGHTVYGLVRHQEKIKAVQSLGIEPILGSLEDADILTKYAQVSDAVIHTADSNHQVAVETLIKALEGSGKPFIHTSGSGVVSDNGLVEHESSYIYDEETVFMPSDPQQDRVFLNQHVRQAGITRGVRTIIIAPSLIYGDAFDLTYTSQILSILFDKSRQMNAGVYIGEGVSRWSNVHIEDLADLYLLALNKAPSASYFYAENGENTFVELAIAMSTSIGYPNHIQSWKLEDATQELGLMARFFFTSNSRVRAIHARHLLGWNPQGISMPAWIAQFVQ
ncbi:NAD-dependent epimerase/dehydratase family protein [Paenibacillus sp. KACC 21273]|uniref:NAD-dependent epimerase/dehydratase family protein n=1 Tax=Paenibacillus sp. KACC 21273 TaxID=3025665 RepID=UPI0023671D35|nr:NAD-dependent epimerase/dehydratase family protein [Paenibacillus sp. KACC 21273]WDF53022.1 NAD-dependent epimerase/dehydratase family protein [Paenibacillus sp. KACC 21273]